ncbi:MAG TPA: DUF1045 domain-containing protein [Azospirillaceae bacterium]|nr:DUF1045 domain-containing protein [Azospirillaceae bacterium]
MGEDRRIAVYYAPAPGSALHVFGSRWLGRDAATGVTLPQPVVPGVEPDRLARLTAAPRGYGFHATLKPPFRLAAGRTEAELRTALASFAASRRPFRVRLGLRSLGGFLALMLAEPSSEMQQLADACVMDLDAFRGPPSEAERAKRMRVGLTARQVELLDRWGYPYVLDQFRFHMTLSERLSKADAALLMRALESLAAEVCAGPVTVDAVTLFEQPSASAPFTITGRFPFGGGDGLPRSC